VCATTVLIIVILGTVKLAVKQSVSEGRSAGVTVRCPRLVGCDPIDTGVPHDLCRGFQFREPITEVEIEGAIDLSRDEKFPKKLEIATGTQGRNQTDAGRAAAWCCSRREREAFLIISYAGVPSFRNDTTK
jgi:hypothetical protein